MSFSLYQATIPSYLQIIGATIGLVDKAEAHCADNNLNADQLIQAKLHDDMLPFAYQIKSVCHHSLGAINGVRQGVFSPDVSEPPSSFSALKAQLIDAKTALQAITAEEVNRFVGQDMRFAMGKFSREFVAENFLMSFTQPNFYFHATTAYDILRNCGVSLGKMDFMGKLQTVA